jgi:hypothetical protein
MIELENIFSCTRKIVLKKCVLIYVCVSSSVSISEM